MFRIQSNARNRNALNKALRVRPEVVFLSPDSAKVEASANIGTISAPDAVAGVDFYHCRAFESDGQTFVHCTCKAGTVGQTDATPVTPGDDFAVLDGQPCYHALAFYVERARRIARAEQAADALASALSVLSGGGIQIVRL